MAPATLARPGVPIGGSHPFLDPNGYWADMIFQLAALRYSMPALYNTLLGHHTITRPGDALGTSYDYQFICEHSALAAYQANPSAIPGVWGLTILRTVPNYANAVQFLRLLFSPQGVALQSATGPALISPPAVNAADYDQVPAELQPRVSRQ